MAARHSLFIRRVQTLIYAQKFPDLETPEIWPFGGAVDFKPTPQQMNGAKCETRGRRGLLVGYHVNPGGSWSGDYLCADLRNFETYSGKNRIRVYRTKTVTWKGDARPHFPLFDARERAREEKLEDGIKERYLNHVPFMMLNEGDDDSDSDEGVLDAFADRRSGEGDV